MKTFRIALVALLLAASSWPLLRGDMPAVQSGQWAATGTMSDARGGASAVLLPSGLVLVTGGTGTSGVLATAELFGPDGQFSAAGTMLSARADHASVLLGDGRVLIVGGRTSEGAVAAAETFGSGGWSAAGQLTDARWGHTATLLADGRVLVVGGENGSGPVASVEAFDPATGEFAVLGTLTSPRKGHAAARLADGRVLIAGGFDGGAVLNSINIFDPSTGSVSVGPSLNVARAGLSATTLLGGKVFFFGGYDGTRIVNSGEVWDPATTVLTLLPPADAAAYQPIPRRDHQAFLLPNNNAVLIVGGVTESTVGGVTGSNAASSAELYLPWVSQVWPTGATTAPRFKGAGSGLSVEGYGVPPAGDGLLMMAGGEGLGSSEIYRFATIRTDKDDYSPGMTVYVSGAGWQPNENVTFGLRELPAEHEARTFTIQADEAGRITNATLFLVEEHHLGIRFLLTARGAASQAQTTFTDARNLVLTFAGTGGGSVTITPSIGTVNAPVSCGGTGTNISSQTVTSTCAPNITVSDNGAIVTFSASPVTGSFFAGWSAPLNLSSSTCTGTTNPCSAVLGGNPRLTVTFSPSARLTLVKTVTNDNGGTAVPTDWTLSASGGPTPISGTTTSAAVTNAFVTPGTYTLSESDGPNGYTAGTYSCVKNAGAPVSSNSITLASSDTATCTINNDDQAAHLIIVKQVVNDNGGTKVAGDFSGSITGVTASDGNTWTGTVTPGVDKTLTSVGSYNITETADPTYTTTYSTDCSGTIALGETKTCTVTNDDKAAHLIVIKHVINDNGGAKVASEFSLTIGGVTATGGQTFNGAESPGTDKTLTTVGAYTVTEGAHVGYDVSLSADCSGTIALGETKTCTVTNDDQPAHLIIIKQVVNDNGGTKVAGDFSGSISGVTASGGNTWAGTVTPGVNKTLTSVGSYAITETADPAYTPTYSADCSGTIALGEVKSCTITNDDIQPKLTVTKTVINDNGGTAGIPDFVLKVGTTVVTSGVETGFNAGTYTISETGPSGYASTFGGACAGGSVTLAVGEVKSCTITNDDIQPKLTVTKTVINDNGGTAGIPDFVLKVGTTVVTSGVETGFNAATYTISETGPSGYASTFGGACAGGSVTLAVGEVKSCTITNDDIQPKLTVTKTVINDNGGTAGIPDFVLKVGTTVVTSGVETGFNAATYTISETGPSGYASTFGGACAGGSVTLAVGEVKSCTITNDDIQPKLTVTKTVINDNGGTAGIPDFVLKVGTTVVTSGVETGFNAATYTISETGPSGYASTFGGACAGGSVTLAVGEVKSCTITNDDIQPKLTVTKTVINDNGGTAGIPDFVLKVGTTVVTSGVETGFNAATYTISETGPSGYASTFGGACAGGSVTLAVGEVKSCTITNDDIAPKLTVTKVVVNNNGGTKIVSDFPLFIDGNGTTSGTQVTLNAGAHTVTETPQAGYAATVTGDCAADGSITLNPGDVKACTITNDDQAPSLTLVKTVINDNGGTATASAFTLAASGPTPISGAGAATSGATFSAGSYTLSETTLSGYTASAWVCVGGSQTGSTIALANGQSATCTITNDDQAPSLTLVKTVINDNGGTATASAFTLTASGPTPISGAGGATSGETFSAGSYTLSETGPSGYAASAWVCTGTGTQTGSAISLANGQSATCTITNDDQAPSLTLVKTVINNNGGTATASAFTLAASGPTPISGAGGATSGPTFSAGSYTLSETTLSGYTASAWVCAGGSQTGSTIALANGQSATCTITNDDQAPSLTLVKTVINDNGGTATASAFTLTASGPTSISGAGGATSGPTFSAGSYALSETGPSGYAPSSWVCVGGSQTGSAIVLALGQSATCTIINDDIQPKLIVIKHVINDNGGTSTAANFPMTVTGSSPSPASFPGSESGTTVMLNAGSYSVSEILPIAYVSSLSADCSGSIAVGQTKTCTVTNNDTYLPLGTMCLGSPGHTILQPINADNTSVFKQKSTVPAKFRVCDASGRSVGTPGVVTDFRLIQILSGTVTDVDEVVDSTTPDTAFRWSATDQQWIFNINTKPLQASNTYVYRISLNDGTTILFQFGLK